jgi:hypothetical protein
MVFRLLIYRLVPVPEDDSEPYEDVPDTAVHGVFNMNLMLNRMTCVYIQFPSEYIGQGGIRAQALRAIMAKLGKAFVTACSEYMADKEGCIEFNYKISTMVVFRDVFINYKHACVWLKCPTWHPDTRVILPPPPTVYHSPDVQISSPTTEQYIDARDNAFVALLYTAIIDMDCIVDKTATGNKLNKVVVSRYSPVFITAACWKVLVSVSHSINIGRLLTVFRTKSRSSTHVAKHSPESLLTQLLKSLPTKSTDMAMKPTPKDCIMLVRRLSKEDS